MLCSHFTQNCIFVYVLEAKNPCFVKKNCSKPSYICVFILSKKSTFDFTKTFIIQEWLVVGSCPTSRWIAFLMLCRLVHNIHSHFNDLILAWNAYLDVTFIVPSECSFPKLQLHVIKGCCGSICTSVKRNKAISNWRLLIFRF